MSYREGSENIYDSTGCQEGYYLTTTADGVRCVDNFMPKSLNITIDEISGDDVIRKIIDQVPHYLREIFTDDSGQAFSKYNTPGVRSSWDWVEQGLGEAARADGLYTSYQPVVEYSAKEAGSPFRHGRSIWSMCAGLVSQVSHRFSLVCLFRSLPL